MTDFRPCIDLYRGKVVQIVGSSLGPEEQNVRENYVSSKDSAWYAKLYQKDGLKGGHVIMLGAGNEAEAMQAVREYPSGLQVGGGLSPSSALPFLDAGADKVIFTSWLFPGTQIDRYRLRELAGIISRDRVVIDLSCKCTGTGEWKVAKDKWQTVTEIILNAKLFDELSMYCSEFLVHAADVEGLCKGIDSELVQKLSEWSPVPVTYAGGARSIDDLNLVDKLSHGKVDLTIGSALDIFGGKGAVYEECVLWNKNHTKTKIQS